MSIRRYRRNEMLTRANVSSPTLSLSPHAMQIQPIRRAASVENLKIAGAFTNLGSLRNSGSTSSLASRSSTSTFSSTNTLVNRPATLSTKSNPRKNGPFTRLPTELQFAVLDTLSHNELLNFRRVSRNCARLAEDRLRKTTGARLAVSRDRLDAASGTQTSIEHSQLALMLFNHQNLASLTNWDVEELRWSRNPTEEIRMVCQALVALHRGSLSGTDARDDVRLAAWAATRTAMGSSEFRKWFVNLRTSAEALGVPGRRPLAEGAVAASSFAPLPESALLSSGKAAATRIWQTTATTFERMAAVSSAGVRALTFLSAAVHYIEIRTSVVESRANVLEAQVDVARLEKFAAVL